MKNPFYLAVGLSATNFGKPSKISSAKSKDRKAAAPTHSASECSSKPSSIKPEREILGSICPKSFAVGMPPIIVFCGWEKKGVWKRIWKHLQSLDDKPLRHLFIDSTTVRAHQHAAGGGQQKQAMGRSCGGLTTKLHAACADDRTAVSFSLSPGQSHDATTFPSVWEGVPKSRWLDAAVMDKAYDSDNIRRFLEYQGIEAVIPARASRKRLFPYDKKKYRMRQKVERFFCRIKQFRRIATRYDKLAKTFMAFVHIVAAFIAFQPNAAKT